jgi:2-keto-4-pentenoate hydratase
MSADINAIAEAIAEAHRDPRQRVPASRFIGLTRGDAMAIQGAVLKRLGESLPVAKVAMPPDGIATGAPIPAAMVIDDGGTIELGERDLAGLEIEVAVRLGADLTPEIAKAGRDAVLQTVEHFVLGIELIGSRIDDRTKAGPFGPLADNMVTGGYVIGTQILADEPKVDGMAITLSSDGAIIQRETAKHPFGDAISPIIAFARMADDHFGGFKKGMVISTGSLSPLLIVPRKGRIEISLGDFAPLSFTLR